MSSYRKYFIKYKYLVWVVSIGILYLYISRFSNAIIDDAYITLNYVRVIISSGTWGFFPGYVTNTATSPLNILLMTAMGLIVGPTIKSSIWIAVIGLFVMTITLTRISKVLFHTEKFGYLASLAFVFNPLLISTIGLESILFAALFVGAIYFYLVKKWHWLSFVLGLLTITRAEGILFFIVFLIFIPSWKLKIRFAGIFLLSITPWYLFSWFYLGSFIPDTFFIKTAKASWYEWQFFNGLLLYYRRYPSETILSFAFIPLILFGFDKEVRKKAAFPIVFFLGSIHFIGYSVLKVPPFHWYYIPQVTAIILLGFIGLGTAYQKYPPLSRQKKILQGVVLFYFLLPSLGMFNILAQDKFEVKEMPIHTNVASHEKYKEIGLWLNEQNFDESIILSGELGTLAYYCNCYLLDVFSNREWVKVMIDEFNSREGIETLFYKLNFLFYKNNPEFPPKQYHLFLGNQTNNRIKIWQISSDWEPQNSLTLIEVLEK